MLRTTAAAVGTLAAAGAGALAWGSLVEARNFTVRTERLPVLPAGGLPFRILHLSDIHLDPRQEDKLEWLSTLSRYQPDLVVDTGDNIASAAAIEPLLEALGPLLDVPGLFVPGSNDYYGPTFANPLRYLAGPSRQDPDRQRLPSARLFDAFATRGWTDLTNRGASTVVHRIRLDAAGTDDPHLGRDDWPGFPGGSATTGRALRLGVTHAPYRRVLDAMVDDGADVIFAGHTHGGQVCVPGVGALVTNCDLPTRQASGLSEWTHRGRTVPLEVSAGIGTSPTAPVRFACRPEAVVLDVVAP
ncbi:metallophosphoesterase [Citricoccus sp. SGAir0253]|uniref:metallophosphoesterase n=1 Tax=Citricoccus sp. SGAir0253 TaxID=2567881 RepID=UPI0010CCD4FE|nr:metallophosphoesterase [Citricoccus sp. SGAir0253]QCU77334.1 metallophosphoesterase [Citricoccus sp. SGAir0253]